MPTVIFDHYPTDDDLRSIEKEKDCKLVSVAPVLIDNAKETGYAITYKVNKHVNKQQSRFF